MPKITTKLTHTKRPLNFYSSIKNAIHSKWIVSLSSDGYAHCGSGNVLKNDGVGIFGFGNPSAWCVLSKTINNQQYQFCIQTDGYMGLRIKYSKLGFNSGIDNLVSSPSAPDQQILIGNGTDLNPVYQQIEGIMLNFSTNKVRINIITTVNILNFTLKPTIKLTRAVKLSKPIVNKIIT